MRGLSLLFMFVGLARVTCRNVPIQSITEVDIYSLVPSDECTSAIKLCYQASKTELENVISKDPIGCPGQNATILNPGTCPEFAYPTHVGKDPIFRTVDIFMKHPPFTPSDVLERCQNRSAQFDFGFQKRALIITTSHSVLGPENCTTCNATGVASAELTVPFYIFKDAKVNVTLASIKGGVIPVDTFYEYLTHWDVRFWNDPVAVRESRSSISVADANFDDFDVIFMAGGWGAAWDLGTSDVLAQKITKAFAQNKVLGSVCHGALGFILATKPDGSLLVNGTTMTAVTNRQIEQLKIASITPLHPQTELEARGANYQCVHGVVTDLDQSLVVQDGHIVTGQNQNSGCETAQDMLTILLRESA